MKINSLNAFGNTPLIDACKHGSSESVKVLLDNGADITLGNKSYSNIVSSAANLECVRVLIDYGEDINSTPGDGHILMTATMDNDIDTVAAVLKLGQ